MPPAVTSARTMVVESHSRVPSDSGKSVGTRKARAKTLSITTCGLGALIGVKNCGRAFSCPFVEMAFPPGALDFQERPNVFDMREQQGIISEKAVDSRIHPLGEQAQFPSSFLRCGDNFLG